MASALDEHDACARARRSASAVSEPANPEPTIATSASTSHDRPRGRRKILSGLSGLAGLGAGRRATSDERRSSAIDVSRLRRCRRNSLLRASAPPSRRCRRASESARRPRRRTPQRTSTDCEQPRRPVPRRARTAARSAGTRAPTRRDRRSIARAASRSRPTVMRLLSASSAAGCDRLETHGDFEPTRRPSASRNRVDARADERRDATRRSPARDPAELRARDRRGSRCSRHGPRIEEVAALYSLIASDRSPLFAPELSRGRVDLRRDGAGAACRSRVV